MGRRYSTLHHVQQPSWYPTSCTITNPLLYLYSQVSMIGFFHQSWSWGMQWGVLVTLPLCHSNNNLNPRFLLKCMPNIPLVLLRWVFSFSVELPTNSICFMWCLLWCFLPIFRFPCDCHIHQLGLNCWVCTTATLLEFTFSSHLPRLFNMVWI